MIDRNFIVGACTKPSTNMGLVLLNDNNEGLQVEFSDGQWIDAPPEGDALIVNVGQLMTRWTNGRLKSAAHG